MAGINPGRNVGRLSIRVIPDTNKFREDLRKRLSMVERTTSMAVRVDKAKLDKTKIREDIRRQMEGFKGIEAEVNVKVTVDKARLKKVKLRQSIQEQFDKFDDIRVNIAAQIQNKEHFEKEVRDMVRRASRNKISLNANAVTAAASAQLKVITRDRFVNLIVRVTKSSATSALTTLAALSGARLSWEWIDNLATSMKNLDKNLPAIVGWTTGITSLVGSIFAATSGLVGIGQGLFSILPAFLVIPGLILNAAGSMTALIVALRRSGEELGSLKDDMSELGDIINDAFWNQARQPILDLVNGLMPQLRNSFRELSTGIGQFTGELAKAFGDELGNGGLEAIFSGIAEGWRILATGAPAFAGAMTSLSQVAAKYTPRLATWFVRQANTFDTWLESVSTDGRLDGWMEGAIASMYDLWDATTGVAGVFKGLWKAAENAGSKGLHGFADMMQSWDRIVNGADFQRGLTAIFRGANTAMASFGDAVRAVGRLVVGLDASFEKFIGSAGKFLGGLIEGAANALNHPTVDRGLSDLGDGLVRALEGILPHLPAIATTFGSFLGLLGDLAGTLLPTAASVLAALMPSVESLINAIGPILPDLAASVTSIAETLGPPLADFVATAAPVLAEALVGIAGTLERLAPVIAELLNGVRDLTAALFPQLSGIDEYSKSDLAPDPDKYMDDPIGYVDAWIKGAQEYAEANPILFTGYLEKAKFSDLSPFVDQIKDAFHGKGTEAAQDLWEEFKNVAPADAVKRLQNALEAQLIDLDWSGTTALMGFKDQLLTEFSDSGLEGARAMWNEISAPMSAETRQKLLAELGQLGPLLSENMSVDAVKLIDVKNLATDIEQSFKNGTSSKYWLDQFVKLDPATQSSVLAQLGEFRDDAEALLSAGGSGAGGGFSRGLSEGIKWGLPDVEQTVRSMKDTVARGMEGSESWLTPNGTAIMGGLKLGMDTYKPTITTGLTNMGGELAAAMAAAGTWLYGPGLATMAGMQSGVNAGYGGVVGAVGAVAGGAAGAAWGSIPAFFGVGAAMMAGIARGISANSGAVSRAAGDAVRRAVSSAQAAGEIHSPSRLTARKIGAPLAQGIAVGINREAAGIERSMVDAIDFSALSGTSPDLTGAGNASARGGVTLNINHPTVRDLKSEAWEAAQLVGAIA